LKAVISFSDPGRLNVEHRDQHRHRQRHRNREGDGEEEEFEDDLPPQPFPDQIPELPRDILQQHERRQGRDHKEKRTDVLAKDGAIEDSHSCRSLSRLRDVIRPAVAGGGSLALTRGIRRKHLTELADVDQSTVDRMEGHEGIVRKQGLRVVSST